MSHFETYIIFCSSNSSKTYDRLMNIAKESCFHIKKNELQSHAQ